ncbi:hypothetical protein HMPREF9582_01841 [Cutibacterium acnes HL060PA1]|nr:hypothetical protein HMPREF9577_01159 [Cutibacterium acnes HL110PA3]EFT62349.1 hypothetical protein HMPREF9578_02448 [Cutibacterium acnes HL110PA4]EFT65632.1 hypothetical protein HMPREF9582_01841 [Cutibacterium acnes HL060PA1]EFT75851.1 hypothetical protein HMPREF9599_00301 [Cutibacterium acnes HL050PA2]EGE67225.1 hypothetical protein HMPREF9341_02454 [Cutibacterium acnes HL103PA1]
MGLTLEVFAVWECQPRPCAAIFVSWDSRLGCSVSKCVMNRGFPHAGDFSRCRQMSRRD